MFRSRTVQTTRPVPLAGRGVLFGLVCALIVLTVGAFDFLQSLESSTTDALFRTRGELYPARQVVLIEIDDATIKQHPWPIPRRIYAQLIDRLTQAGAKTIALDVLFTRPSGSPADDAALAKATAQSKRVIHAAVFNLDSHLNAAVSVGQEGSAVEILNRFQVPDSPHVSPQLNVYWGSAPLPELQSGAAGIGHVNAPPEEDGVLRRVPHLVRFYGGQNPVFYPSLALAATTHFLGAKPGEIRTEDGEIVLSSGNTSSEARVPFDHQSRTWINWIGAHDSFESYAANEVLRGEVPDAIFKDRLVIIGVSASGAYERNATPFSRLQPMVDLQANAADNILKARALRAHEKKASPLLWLAFVFGMAALIGSFSLGRSARYSGPLALALGLALWFSALGALNYFNVLLPVASPVLAGFLTWSLCVAYTQYLETQKLRRAEERYARAVRGANDGLWDWNLETDEIYFAPRWKAMLGHSENQIGNKPAEWLERIHPDDREHMEAQLQAHLNGGVSHFESRYRIRHADGRWVWMLARGMRVCDAKGRALRIAGSQSDISQQVEASEQLEHNAFYDALTSLPNRVLFLDVLRRALSRSRRRAHEDGEIKRFAVLFLDLDRFKLVNDSLGHAAGDELLIAVARRLESCLRPEDVAARLGGDEFTVLLDEVGDAGDATRVAERIHQELAQPFTVSGQEVFTTPSIGIAMSSPSYKAPEELLRDADTAMYRAKADGRARHAVFDEKMHAQALDELQLETDLRRALEDSPEQFLVYYQPIVNLESGELSGFEALVRWQHPERGLVSPGLFVPLAEETGLVVPLDLLVLQRACSQTRVWQEMWPERKLTISVNLSSKQFAQLDVVNQVKTTLAETALDARALKLEITEGALMNSPERAAIMLHELRGLGIRLSIDDFGTGYSSLSYLHQFPLDTLKVDQSFVRRIGDNGENSEIVHTIVTLARNLNLSVIAEGIETSAQMHQLRSVLCDYGQGYLFARPMPTKEAQQLLESGKTWQVAPKTKIETSLQPELVA